MELGLLVTAWEARSRGGSRLDGWIEQRPGDGWTGMDPEEEDRCVGGAEENEGGMGGWWLAVGDPDGD